MSIKSPLIIFLLLLQLNLFAQQEVITPLKFNKELQGGPNSNLLINRLSVTNIDLPFIDDFSGSSVYPDQSKWLDNKVYINNSFCLNPFTIGVATFDGLNEMGNPYNNSFANAQGGCDTLTSFPINLFTKPLGGNYSLADSIVLSFYYEKKGLGDAPEITDSLLLDFYNPTTNTWSRQWGVAGGLTIGQDSIFNLVNITINNAAYYQDGFQFRFRTYGAQTGNLDIWHLDYVRLRAAYNTVTGQLDTLLRDVAFIKPLSSLLNGYTSIPWDHFKSLSAADQQTLINDSLMVNYRVNDNAPNDVGFNTRIYDFTGGYVSGFGQTNGNIFPNKPNNINLTYSSPLDSIFPLTPALSSDSTFFMVKSFFSNSASFSGVRDNDTVYYKQAFYNYYSYDDGSAEVAYDLINAPNGKLAMKFNIIKPDTLRAVRFYFTQQGASVSNNLFTIKIWSSLNPETVIYQEANQKPSYVNEVNGFSTYVLDQVVPVSGVIYIGFQQVLPDGLHLGFDRNTTSNTNMFYSLGGAWNNVGVANGSFMIRPVMGDTNLFAGLSPSVNSLTFELFPNPASQILNVRVHANTHPDLYEICSIEGQLIEKNTFTPIIDCSKLKPGIYLLKIVEGSTSMTKKFVVQ
ncbi:MAG: T9SS type A sorting domain-containing protein [Bacteroidota bacterium]